MKLCCLLAWSEFKLQKNKKRKSNAIINTYAYAVVQCKFDLNIYRESKEVKE